MHKDFRLTPVVVSAIAKLIFSVIKDHAGN